MKYDVFISCKSEDYDLAEPIYDFLNKNGVRTFLSSKELRKSGQAEYLVKISEYLDSCSHLVLFSSRPENVQALWVKFEWMTFQNELLSGRKNGQIVTILSNMQVDQLPLSLRHYESFTLMNYQESLLNYVGAHITEPIDDLSPEEKMIKKVKDYSAYIKGVQKVEGEKLIPYLKTNNITKKECPVCDKKMEVLAPYCPHCGWPMSPIDGIARFSNISYPAAQIKLAKAFHNNVPTGHAKLNIFPWLNKRGKGFVRLLIVLYALMAILFSILTLDRIQHITFNANYLDCFSLLYCLACLFGIILIWAGKKQGLSVLFYSIFPLTIISGRHWMLPIELHCSAWLLLSSLYVIDHYRPLSSEKLKGMFLRIRWKGHIIIFLSLAALSSCLAALIPSY